MLIFIFGIVIFGSLGSFLSNVNTAVTDVADAVAEDESFSVDFLQKNSQPMLYKEHSDNDGLGGSSSEASSSEASSSGKQSSSGSSSGGSSSGKQSSGGISSFVGSSQNSFSNNDAGNSFIKDSLNFVSNNDKSDNESSFWNIIDILGPKSESSKTEYDDYQIDKETGMFDSEGNPIFLSIVSTSGGQMEPGIYEVYWSELHVFNHTKIK